MCRTEGCNGNAGSEHIVGSYLLDGMPEHIAKTVIYATNKRKERLAKEIAAFKEVNKELLDENNGNNDFNNDNSSFNTKHAFEPIYNLEYDVEHLMETLNHETFELMKSENLLEDCDHTENVGTETKTDARMKQMHNATAMPTAERQKEAQNSNSTLNNVAEWHKQNPSIHKKSNDKLHMDWLARSTAILKIYVDLTCCAYKKCQQTRAYKLLTTTTQPAHIILVGIMSILLVIFWPNLFDNARSLGAESEENDVLNSKTTRQANILTKIVYLGSFAMHFGAQIWMTFVSGLSLYFSLPRHTFGQCQKILFPRYFGLSSVLSICTLVIYIKYFMNNLNWTACIQVIALTTITIIEILVYLYLAPPMLRLMQEKYKIEYVAGSGSEVGSEVQGSLVRCPHYQRIHKAFRRFHMIVAVGNMIALLASCLHLYFLASKIQIN